MTTKTKRAAVIATYKSKSNPDADPYEVRISRQDGAIFCSCPGWKFKKNCTHLKQFFADLDDPQMTERIKIDRYDHCVKCSCTDSLVGEDVCEHVHAFVDSLPEVD
jgi:hypothetical protein